MSTNVFEIDMQPPESPVGSQSRPAPFSLGDRDRTRPSPEMIKVNMESRQAQAESRRAVSENPKICVQGFPVPTRQDLSIRPRGQASLKS